MIIVGVQMNQDPLLATGKVHKALGYAGLRPSQPELEDHIGLMLDSRV